MTSLLLATRNAHKTREFRKLLGPNFEVTDLSSFPEMALPGESGRSFEENARLKALSISQPLVGTSRCDVRRAPRTAPTFVVADDSGLEVDALRGAPGIFSARYAGQNATDKENVEKLLQELNELFTGRQIVLGRELRKKFEQFVQHTKQVCAAAAGDR